MNATDDARPSPGKEGAAQPGAAQPGAAPQGHAPQAPALQGQAGDDEVSRATTMAAHEWHAEAIAGEMDAATRRRFYAWLAEDPRHEAAYRRAERLWQSLGALERGQLPASGAASLGTPRRARRFLVKSIGVKTIGASAAIAASLLLLIAFYPLSRLLPGSVAFDTAVGQAQTFELADGSTVALDGDSSLTSLDDAGERRVLLHDGAAYFDVAAIGDRPFVVDAGDLSVRVVGTSFEVHRYDERVKIAVSSGTVQVAPDAARAPEPLSLSAGQAVMAGADGALSGPERIEPRNVAAWRRGRLVYLDAPLAEVVADANRHYSGWIVIPDPRAAAIGVTANFESGDIDRMLATLEEAFPITIWRPFNGFVAIVSD